MKVCLHIQPASQSLGGSETLAANIASLLRHQHDVEIVHHRPWLELTRLAEFSGVDLEGVTARIITRRQTYFFSPAWNPVEMWLGPRRWGRELAGDCDVFITITHELPAFNPAPVGVLFLLFPNSSPLTSWPFQSAPGTSTGLRTRLARAFYQRQYAALWRGYGVRLAISEFTATWGRRRWALDTQVLYPLVDISTVHRPKEPAVLTLGRFSVSGVSKRQLEMATAFSCASGLAGWRLVSVGPAATLQERDYAAAVAATGDHVNVQLNLPREDVRTWLARASIFWHAAGLAEDEALHPELAEHFGIVTVEAMANGCVPIVIGRGGQPEIVEHGRSGFLCASIEEMASRTAQLAADPERWTRMSAAARERAQAFGKTSFEHRLQRLAPFLRITPSRELAPEERPDFSIVICTRNRANRLETCLRRVAALSYAGTWEVVVVDNDSTDHTPEVVAQFTARAPVHVTVIRERRRGLGAARNAGLSAARGTFIAFTDDDCYPEQDWLTHALQTFKAHPDAGVVGGRILLFDRTDAPYTIQEHNHFEKIPPRSFINAGLVQGANFLVRSSVIAAIGGFDRNLGAGTAFPCEDIDFASRASFAGFSTVYDPALVVHHHHGRKPGPAIAQLEQQYAYGRGAHYAGALLNARSRSAFLRNLYWKWLSPSFRRAYGARLRELAGGLRFLWLSARRAGQDPYKIEPSE